MQIGEISFCDRTAYNIKSDDLKKKILDEIHDRYGCKVIQKHHDRFECQNNACVQRVTRIPHLCSTRTNGNPYFLYLTRIHFGIQCIFIDKKIQQGYFYPRMIMVKLWFDDVLFNGTVFEGEMIKNHDGTWQYVINDLLAYKGQSLKDKTLTQSINILYELLKNEYIEDDTTCCELRVKKYFHFEDIPYMIDTFIPNLDYTCRGIYFKPIYKKFRDYLLEFDHTLIKREKRIKVSNVKQQSFLTEDNLVSSSSRPNTQAKQDRVDVPCVRDPVNDETRNVDIINESKVFQTRKTKNPDVYEIYDAGDDNVIDIPCIPDMKSSLMMNKAFESCTFLETIPVVYRWHGKFKKWYPQSVLSNQ